MPASSDLGNRAAEIEALCLVSLGPVEKIGLLERLDALDGHAHMQFASQRNDKTKIRDAVKKVEFVGTRGAFKFDYKGDPSIQYRECLVREAHDRSAHLARRKSYFIWFGRIVLGEAVFALGPPADGRTVQGENRRIRR